MPNTATVKLLYSGPWDYIPSIATVSLDIPVHLPIAATEYV